jgi:hypothetical protein
MNWQLKSAIQRFCAGLPFGSDIVYYQLQRRFGSFRNPPSPEPMLAEAVDLAKWVRAAGASVAGMRCFEVGTGRRVDLPFGLYLLGAGSTVTCDLNQYLKAELVDASLAWIRENRSCIESQFLPASDNANETRRRIGLLASARSAREAMETAGIQYRSPADAARTGLPAGTVDLHYSYTVNEHIPAGVLEAIYREARRLLSPAGIALHHVDPSDHFSHEDKSITSINFLQFTSEEWERHGGNRFAYHNRLRAHHHAELFERSGFEILRQETNVDRRALAMLQNGFRLAPEFRQYTPEQLCGSVIRLMGRPRAAD